MWLLWPERYTIALKSNGAVRTGTVATEHLAEGPRQHPKDIPKLALVASLVDPRFKFGPGFSDHDEQYIRNIIRHLMTVAALAEQAEQEPRQIQQQQQPPPQ
jgi:hypothetical protein